MPIAFTYRADRKNRLDEQVIAGQDGGMTIKPKRKPQIETVTGTLTPDGVLIKADNGKTILSPMPRFLRWCLRELRNAHIGGN